MGSSGQKCLCIQGVSSTICCRLPGKRRRRWLDTWTLWLASATPPPPPRPGGQRGRPGVLLSTSPPPHKEAQPPPRSSSLAHNLPPAGSCHKFCSNVRCSTPELPVPQILFNLMLATWTTLLVLFTYVESFHFWLQSSDVLLS